MDVKKGRPMTTLARAEALIASAAPTAAQLARAADLAPIADALAAADFPVSGVPWLEMSTSDALDLIALMGSRRILEASVPS